MGFEPATYGFRNFCCFPEVSFNAGELEQLIWLPDTFNKPKLVALYGKTYTNDIFGSVNEAMTLYMVPLKVVTPCMPLRLSSSQEVHGIAVANKKRL